MRKDQEAPTAGEVAMLREKARHIRLETIRLIEIAKVGHYSSVFSCAEIFAALYYDVMRLRPGEPQWPDRDRFLMARVTLPSACSPCWPIWALSIMRCWTATRGWAAPWVITPT